MAARRPTPQRVKLHRIYSTAELAACCGVHKNTVRHWQANGLKPVSKGRPTLFDGAIRDIFRKAFAAAGLPYFNPHSLRDTLVQLGEQVCTTPEQFKAWSQNLGHERVMTTLTSYGTVAPHRQAELIRGMGAANGTAGKLAGTIDPAFVAQVVAAIQKLPGEGLS